MGIAGYLSIQTHAFSTLAVSSPLAQVTSAILPALPLDDNLSPRRPHTCNNLVLCLFRKLASSRELVVDTRGSFRLLPVFFAHILHLVLQALLLGFDQILWVSHIFALIQVLMPATEALHHVSALVRVARLAHKFGILTLSALLQGQMGLLLPLLVDAVLVLHHEVLLADLFTSFILSLLNDLALPIDLLERVALLDLVPLHDRLALRVHVLVVRDQVQRHAVEEILLVLVPQ